MSVNLHKAPTEHRQLALPANETIASLAKGLAIVELFDGKRTRLTAAEAAKAVGTSRAAARRCLLTLSELGYLTRHPEGSYFTPCPRITRLGRGYDLSTSFVRAAEPLLERARDAIQDPVALAIRDGREVLFLARASVQRVVTTGIAVGGHLPLFCSATGRVFLSELEEIEQKRLLHTGKRLARTPRTECDEARLLAILRNVRERGMAWSDQELELGMRSLAMPVRSESGGIRATVSSSALTSRITLRQMIAEREPVLRKLAEQLAELLRDFGDDALPS